jgi:hypothetical protein
VDCIENEKKCKKTGLKQRFFFAGAARVCYSVGYETTTKQFVCSGDSFAHRAARKRGRPWAAKRRHTARQTFITFAGFSGLPWAQAE